MDTTPGVARPFRDTWCPLIGASFLTLLVPIIAHAQAGHVATESGLQIVTFARPEGIVTAYLPDDVGPGEPFSGTVEGPSGYVLALGDLRARTGKRFDWRTPGGVAHRRLILTLKDKAGNSVARAQFRVAAPRPLESSFRFPVLVQSGHFFPIRGPFDGRSRTTKVTVDGRATAPLAESIRKAIIRASATAAGLTRASLVERHMRAAGEMRTLAIDVAAGSMPHLRRITIAGLAGFAGDVPLRIAGDWLHVQESEIPAAGTFSAEHSVRAPRPDIDARLVIPQTERDEVTIVLRTPRRAPGVSLGQQHGEALQRLGFDAFPASMDLLDDIELGNGAAEALLVLDETRALKLIFASMPK